MLAWFIDRPGGLDRFKLREVPDPRPGPGEILIKVRYAACNWADTQKRRGVYPEPITYPVVIGTEASGRVVARGASVGRSIRLGDRVAAIAGPGGNGAFAELLSVPAEYAFKLPDDIGDALGAAFPVVVMTAYHLLHSSHRLRKGETILVHAIGGAVGLMLTQMAIAAGAQVIGTVSAKAKGRRAKAFGAARIIDRSREDFVEAANAFTGGRGVDLVIDSLGSTILERSFDCLRPYGTIINIGEAAGYPEFDIRPKLYERSTALAGFELRNAGPGSARWQRGLRYILPRLADGRLKLPIEKRYPFARLPDAQRHLESRTVSGKLLIKVS